MKSEAEIRDRIDNLKSQRGKESFTVPRKHGRGRRWSTLGITQIRRLEGQIEALEWALGEVQDDKQEKP